ncbi:fatty acid cis/trans isomerase [Cellvibrio japonicus]|uniref:Fatty acid cis/trans isomerase n=1 Tax=Cellvibrio japonicus (strain Ueda107) TaxID=498211 RepID=B3PE26_CELJU|nr:fatty acid cis/trans isomerase [Cellvibrio japonicus]ACE83915.1 fatty acid cis/trans isomerase [Cellvibrio japonicus Ueda107]
MSDLDRRYGRSLAHEANVDTDGKLTYYHQVRPLLEQRCVVCHGCYDAPCQLKLESYESFLRGASAEKVYNGSRLLGATLTRMFEDAQTTAQWREKGFYPVINERKQSAENNLQLGVMAQLLQLKQAHPLPAQPLLGDAFDLSLNRNQYCPRDDQIADYQQKKPLWGMPYGLPALAAQEHQLIMDWLAAGAPAGKAPQIPAQVQALIQQWEDFFNGDDLKSRLVSRYLYEHLFLAQLYFENAPDIYFRLVRSSTPPGQPIQRISRARPFDDPGVEHVYYRLWRDPSSVVAKTHMPYLLNASRMAQWHQWFIAPQYEVKALPSYEPGQASNPFTSFAAIPIEARYRFLLSEAQFTIMNFIKGPVCRGQVALNVIQDHFWVFFLDPKTQSTQFQEQFLEKNVSSLQLPAEEGNTFRPLTNWLKYSSMQEEYLRQKATYMAEVTKTSIPVTLDVIWDGDGSNPNAALTIFRHSDSASVHKGLLGGPPKTAWIIGYPLLERIHYLLVAGFDVYGNVSHQLLTRLYMDFLRMEGEMTFISMLPTEVRRDEIYSWYIEPTGEQRKLLDIYLQQDMHVAIDYQTGEHKRELYGLLQQRLQKVLPSTSFFDNKLKSSTVASLIRMQHLRSSSVQWLPEITLLEIPTLGVYSLLHNRNFSNLSSLFGEEQRHRPHLDSVSFLAGVAGSYPNSFLRVEETDLPGFVSQLEAISSEEDYRRLLDKYGVRRTSADFWRFSDRLHERYRQQQPEEYGLLDYNRLENR